MGKNIKITGETVKTTIILFTYIKIFAALKNKSLPLPLNINLKKFVWN